MLNITVVPYNEIGRSLVIKEDGTLMDAIRDNGFDDLLALCGGYCSCATCHVYIDGQHLDLLAVPSSEEVSLLEASEARLSNSRLACQIILKKELDGIVATIAPMNEND